MDVNDQQPAAPESAPAEPAPVNRRRRGFLRAAAGGGALGTLAVLSGHAEAAPATPAAAAEPDKPKGYHETEHIRKYYATARYW